MLWRNKEENVDQTHIMRPIVEKSGDRVLGLYWRQWVSHFAFALSGSVATQPLEANDPRKKQGFDRFDRSVGRLTGAE